MKKRILAIVSVILVFSMLFVFAGCDNNAEVEETTTYKVNTPLPVDITSSVNEEGETITMTDYTPEQLEANSDKIFAYFLAQSEELKTAKAAVKIGLSKGITKSKDAEGNDMPFSENDTLNAAVKTLSNYMLITGSSQENPQGFVGTEKGQVVVLDSETEYGEKNLAEVLPLEHLASLTREEVESATVNYRNTIQAVFDRCIEGADLTKTLILPRDAHNDPELEQKILKEYMNFAHAQTQLLRMGFAGYETPVAIAMQRYFKDLKCKNNLYMPFTEPDETGGRKWYTSFCEYDMFLYHKNGGNMEEAKKVLDSQLKYVVNNEYYMSERQHSHDCYYAPWQPNGSANGRTLSMLIDVYSK